MQSELEKIKAIVTGLIPDSRVILFGSRARNTHDARSDYDIMVVTEKEYSLSEKSNLKSLIRVALAKTSFATDILMNSENEMRKKNNLPGHIVKTILKEGITL